MLLTSWSTTQVVFTFGNEYANYGPINAGDQIEVTVQGASDTVTASFPAAVPTVTALSPDSGPTVGGTSVTITGTGFTGATSVTFGGYLATNVDVVSSTTITATSPGYSAGVHAVQVTTPAGTSAKVAAADFTYS